MIYLSSQFCRLIGSFVCSFTWAHFMLLHSLGGQTGMSKMAQFTCWIVGAGLGSPSCGLSSFSRFSCLPYLVSSGQHSMRKEAEALLHNMTSATFCQPKQVPDQTRFKGINKQNSSFDRRSYKEIMAIHILSQVKS